MMDILVTMEGYNGLSPSPNEVLKPFSYGLSSPALAPALFCVFFFFPFHFINVSFTDFFLSDFIWISTISLFFLAFLFLVWFGLRLLFVFWSHKFSVSELSLSPHPVLSFFWSDGVCVFIKSLLLLNVRSVAFVQGKCRLQCNCNKCLNLSWIFFNLSWGGVHDDMYV